MPAPTNRKQPDQAASKRRSAKQSELLSQFSHLDRQRDAVLMATRILRLVAAKDPETAEIAMEIAGTALRMKSTPNDPAGQLPHPMDGGITCPTEA